MKCVKGWEGLRFVIVALPGLFSYLFWDIFNFHTRHPEYFILCLKHSVLGLGGTKQPAEADLSCILVLTLFRRVKLFKNVCRNQIMIDLEHKLGFSQIEPIIYGHDIQIIHRFIGVVNIVI